MKSILDPKFRYTPSAQTNLGRLYKRIKAARARAWDAAHAENAARDAAERALKVRKINSAK